MRRLAVVAAVAAGVFLLGSNTALGAMLFVVAVVLYWAKHP